MEFEPRHGGRRDGAPVRRQAPGWGRWRDGCVGREGGDRGAQGRVGGEDAEIGMAVKARRGRQRGEAVKPLERGPAMRGTAAGACFRGDVGEVLAIEFAQPIQSERWPGASCAAAARARRGRQPRCAPSHPRRCRRRVATAPSPAHHCPAATHGALKRATAAGARMTAPPRWRPRRSRLRHGRRPRPRQRRRTHRR